MWWRQLKREVIYEEVVKGERGGRGDDCLLWRKKGAKGEG